MVGDRRKSEKVSGCVRIYAEVIRRSACLLARAKYDGTYDYDRIGSFCILEELNDIILRRPFRFLLLERSDHIYQRIQEFLILPH